ncbi:hypothetical protein [Parendozoicomonas haliclonae]|uniref:t-SNARE coiled-coil homology domain-containing protein n=1 Tax=Parendozoicomonas haliclonae TaxID=1960125 RepID=A0A1X7AI48_9GAMM|nr:hypothetical protein [Parendozoicomonas haliclonae]SMA44156.1 hypothetical protein EHSB41UT_01745 [Parendozoicomonas haliclonae]
MSSKITPIDPERDALASTVTDLVRIVGRLDKKVDDYQCENRARFDQMDKRLDGMDNRFDQMNQRLDKMDDRFDQIDKRLDKMDDRFDRLEKNTNERFDQLELLIRQALPKQ